MSNRILGDKLYSMRKARNESLRIAANGIGISHMYLSQLEAGIKNPSDEVLEKLSAYYDEPFVTLYSLSKEQTPDKQKFIANVARASSNLTEDDMKKILEFTIKLHTDKEDK